MIYVLRQWKDGKVTAMVQHLERHRLPFQMLDAYAMQLEQYPQLSRNDAIIGLGGPASVCRLREPDYDAPFLLDEEQFLRAAERHGVPFLGICLSHQLRGRMANQEVRTGSQVIGLHPVHLTVRGASHWLFESLPAELVMYQNHADYVASLPDSAVLLARSPTCAIEAVAWSDASVTCQFHPDALRGQLPAVLEHFSAALSAAGFTVADMLARLPADYDRYTARLFDNFLYRAGYIRRPAWRPDSIHAIAA